MQAICDWHSYGVHCGMLFSRTLRAALAGACLLGTQHVADAVENTSINSEMNDLVRQIRQLEEISDLVQREYINPVTREELWNGAIRGMIEGLDRHSRYLSKDQTNLAIGQQADRGRGFGFDWHYDLESNATLITRVIPGSSADKAGLIRGDRIIALAGKTLSDVNRIHIQHLFTEAHRQLDMRLMRADNSIKSVTLLRGDFTDSGVLEHRMITKDIGYVRISRFRDGSMDNDTAVEGVARTQTGKAFRQELDVLASKPIQALVIDLRGNGGGSIHAAVEVADCFLNAGAQAPTVIVEQLGRNNPARNHAYTASSVNTYPHWPVCVLIDSYTASSAEIVAAAWQDHKRAIVVGVPSAGKTSIQETFMLKDGSSIRLSVAHYQTPNGQALQDSGLQPDIAVQQSDLNRLQIQQQQMTDLEKTEMPDTDPARDPVIEKAIDVLVGILVYKKD